MEVTSLITRSDRPDVVYFLKQGAVEGKEFVYSLRSVAKNLPHNRVWIIGPDYPSHLQHVQWTPWRQRGHKLTDIYDKWVHLSMFEDMSEEVYVFSDDEFLLRFHHDIPSFHWRTAKERGELRAENPWVQMVARTDQALKEKGIANPLHFDVHIPMKVNRLRLAKAMGWMASLEEPHMYLPRTVYGNLEELEGIPLRSDVKVNTPQELFAILSEARGFLSSSETTFTEAGVEYLLRTLFPQPCYYEGGFRPAYTFGREDTSE